MPYVPLIRILKDNVITEFCNWIVVSRVSKYSVSVKFKKTITDTYVRKVTDSLPRRNRFDVVNAFALANFYDLHLPEISSNIEQLLRHTRARARARARYIDRIYGQ